jgi:hypothetical protein
MIITSNRQQQAWQAEQEVTGSVISVIGIIIWTPKVNKKCSLARFKAKAA